MSDAVFVQLQILSSLMCWKGIRCLQFKNLECNFIVVFANSMIQLIP